MKKFFKSPYGSIALRILGILIVFFIWWFVSSTNIINNSILPTPGRTWSSFIGLFDETVKGKSLFQNVLFSIKINMAGYLISVLTALPVGFILGVNKTTRQMFEPIVNSLRFIPITALGGIFVAIAGLTIWTKIDFLAFGIWVYLVPVVVQRITEVPKIQLDMLKTLGASPWQSFWHVILPFVKSRLIDDVRILVGISWTYIIVAELKNIEGGIGAIIYLKGEKSADMGVVYSMILLIVLIGVVQDFTFKKIDRIIHKFKYA